MAASRRALLPAAVVSAAWCAPTPAPACPPLAAALSINRRAALGAGAVHLTFDDGPHPQGTPAVLEILDSFGARATFFLVAEQVQRYPALARAIADAGHAVASHGHRHRCQLRVAPRALADDLARAADVLGAATGALAPLYRPPYGVFSAAGVALVRRRGLTPWLWSRWGRDWRADATASSITASAAQGLRDGDVVLLHDADHYSAPGCWEATVAALPRILGRAQAAGLRAAALPVGETSAQRLSQYRRSAPVAGSVGHRRPKAVGRTRCRADPAADAGGIGKGAAGAWHRGPAAGAGPKY
jgi:peptidoglycan/xylan/chitin deacetylase (PgdA/CDA1 family)